MGLTYRFFGGEAKEPLPSLKDFKVAKQAKGNAQVEKTERKAIRVVPKTKFGPILEIKALVEKLFGL
jgi:hypothetical protein